MFNEYAIEDITSNGKNAFHLKISISFNQPVLILGGVAFVRILKLSLVRIFLVVTCQNGFRTAVTCQNGFLRMLSLVRMVFKNAVTCQNGF